MDIIIDCFAGGGGASVGIEMALGRSVDIAINHDKEAIRMHKVNHPNTQHLTEDIFKVDLQRYVKGRHRPLDTITTKDRFGLVTVLIGNEQYVIKDIFLRMLKPSELKIMQGFPEDYIIDRDIDWKPYPLKEQVARIGNSVVPVMAQKLVEANCPYLIVGKRTKNLIIDSSEKQLKIAI